MRSQPIVLRLFCSVVVVAVVVVVVDVVFVVFKKIFSIWYSFSLIYDNVNLF